MSPQQQYTTPFLTSHEVMARYHISYTTLWRRMRDGDMPPPRFNKNTRNKLWHIDDLEEYEKKEA